jgi:UDP-N-acetylglucosamine 4,6-dehydratase/5-epimerase
MIKNKTILIIGGSGSLGNELVKEYLHNNRIVIYSRSENLQYTMKQTFNNNENLSFVIGDIRDRNRIKRILLNFKPDIIIIASALKHIDVCETNIDECVSTNITGVENVIDVVNEISNYKSPNSIETVLFVSTDKACAPSNVYGMSKSISERLIAQQSEHVSNIKFVNVRYGNVLSSRGSLIPFYKRLLTENSPFLPLTDPDMTRYFMSLKQSVKLIEYALCHAESGDTVVPKYINSYRIKDIADYYVKNHNKEIRYIGIRPGEKVYETLISQTESFRTMDKDDYYIIKPTFVTVENPVKFENVLGEFNSAQASGELNQFIINELELVPKKRIAICIAGFIRTWDITKRSFVEQLIKDKNYEYDLFIHTYQQNYYESTAGKSDVLMTTDEIHKLFDGLNLCSIVIEDRDGLYATMLDASRFSHTENYNAQQPESSDVNSITIPIGVRTYDHLRKLHECNELRKEYELENNVKYDLVVKTRFDLCYFNSPKWEDCNDGKVYFEYGACFGWPNDTFCITTPVVMDNWYANRFLYLDEMIKSNEVSGICAHKTLEWMLAKGGIEISSYRPVNTLCVRSESSTQYNGDYKFKYDMISLYDSVTGSGETDTLLLEQVKRVILLGR